MLVNKEAFWKFICRLVCKLPIAFKKKKKSLYDILAVIKMLQINTYKAVIAKKIMELGACKTEGIIIKKNGFL